MKTQFTMSVDEAEQRLTSKMLDDIPYSDNDVSVKIVLPNVQLDNLPIQQTSKIALIKLVRSLAEDLRYGRLAMTAGESTSVIGEKYFGLGDAKAYVEKYLKDNTYQKV